eukprot:1159521-Pelagomonas_calceolata.AAC.13
MDRAAPACVMPSSFLPPCTSRHATPADAAAPPCSTRRSEGLRLGGTIPAAAREEARGCSGWP